jgi:two-component system LytT family response regulator
MASNQLLSVNSNISEVECQAEPVRAIVGCSSQSILSKLRKMVRAEPMISVIAACANGQDLLAACDKLVPELLILDGRITGPDAFTVAALVQAKHRARVVLISENVCDASAEAELIATEFRAQPFHQECLNLKVRQTLELKSTQRNDRETSGHLGSKATRHLSRTQDAELAANLGSQNEKRRNGAEQRMMRKLLVRDSGVVKVVPFDDIEWVDAAGDYMCVHAKGETLVMRSTLRELMEKLDADIFARVHRSTIVNVEKIVSLTPLPKGAGLLELSVGKTLKVSRNYRDAVKDLFQ